MADVRHVVNVIDRRRDVEGVGLAHESWGEDSKTPTMKASTLLIEAASGVLGRTTPCDVPRGYASVVVLPAALLDALSEQPATRLSGFAAYRDVPVSYCGMSR